MDISFEEYAKNEFEFLVDEYGFSIKESQDYLIVYQSESVEVRISYDPGRTHELDIDICELAEIESRRFRSFSISYLLDLLGVKSDITMGVHSGDMNVIKKFVSQIAQLVKEHAVELLKGNREYYSYLYKLMAEQNKDYYRIKNLNWIRSEVVILWAEKDYENIVDKLSPYRDLLSKSETMKLDYCLKNINKKRNN